ncbi:class I SAM-dependent methyltransferase [Gaetbulibacter aquiaggeris]|uniref:Class I SAM-dependent methyltransferase n=1 Tax=Gaetbulibacter aquiaggeris TaxID=1735373 RepID=A0ABW7MKL4_9FLAO
MKRECKLCFNESDDIIEVEEMMFGFKTYFEYLYCDSCQSLSLINIPNNMVDYYPRNYYSFVKRSANKFKNWISKSKSANTLGDFSIIGCSVRFLTGRNSNLKAIKICKPDKNTSRILDIGCGDGFLLDKLNEQGFKKLFGIDPYLEKEIQKNDYKIRKESVEGLVNEKCKFDIIILSHVFEHFEEPHSSLKNIYKLLESNGALILRSPISSCYAFKKYKKNWYQIDAPRHILIPSFSGLKQMCEKLGFRLQNYFFDSDAKQFLISANYKRGIPMISQNTNILKTRFYPKGMYFTIFSRILNLKDKGDQATFIFQKK